MAEEKGEERTAAEAKGEEMWEKVVEMTQTAFGEGLLAKEATFSHISSPSASAAVLSSPFSSAKPPRRAAASPPLMSSAGTESSMSWLSMCIGIPSPRGWHLAV